MDISKRLDRIPVKELIVAHRYDNVLLYVSLAAFLAMGSIFCLILSL